ncbi:MAG: hypothetical protein WDN69_08805 [Aliidongia sp.]
MFYDGAGFLVPKSLGVKSARQLSGAAVCLQQGAPDTQHLTDYFHGQQARPESGRHEERAGDRAGLLLRTV